MLASKQIAFGKAAGAAKPYKARLEYLESTGTQYIDTGYTLDYVTSQKIVKFYSRCKMELLQHTGWTQLVGTYHAFFYGLVGSATTYYNSNNTISWDSGFVDIEYKREDGAWGNYFNGVKTGTASVWNSYTDKIVAFASGDSNDMIRPIKCRMAQFSLSINEVDLFDLIPVLDNADTPCMYDEVSGEFFYNQGTGEFIAGPEI